MRGIGKLLLAALLAATALVADAGGATAAALEEVPGEFDGPMFVTSYPNDPEKLLVVERRGKIDLYQGGKTTTFADLSARVGCVASPCTGERGMMSIAVAPDFATSGRLYADYADQQTGTIHIDELTASGDTATWTRNVLEIPHTQSESHNGGQLQFGPDGYLYASTGDGGGSNDQFHNAQNPNTLLGKVLRIDPSQSSPSAQIWNMGLRNPFRFSFDALTGDMLIGDVGQSAREEVDMAPSPTQGVVGGQGWNYGWNCREGLIPGTAADDLPGEGCKEAWAAGDFTDPVFDYSHEGAGEPCAIIGGYVVRDPSVPDLFGRYVYGDLCEAEVRSLLLPPTVPGRATDDRSEGLGNLGGIVSFGEDSCDRVYVVNGEFEVFRLVGPKPAVCPSPTGGAGGPSATEVRLRARRRRGRGHRFVLTATVLPCAGRLKQRVVLTRGGIRPYGSAAIGPGCRARFRVRVRRRASFVAAVRAYGPYTAASSGALVVGAVKAAKPRR